MIFKAKAKSQGAWQDYEEADIYEQFRPAWFHFSTASSEPKTANTMHSHARMEEVMDILHPPKGKTSESRRLYTSPPKLATHLLSNTRDQSFLAFCKRLWIDEELFFAMNKLSLLGLVIGLMILGALFFFSGFLMAVNLYSIGAPNATGQLAVNYNPQHMPSPGFAQAQGNNPNFPGTKNGQNAAVAPQYASVGGVSMIPSPRLPSQMQPLQKPVAPTIPTRGMVSAQQHYPRPYANPLPQPAAYPQQPQMVYAYPPVAPAPATYPAGYAPVAPMVPVAAPYGAPGQY